MSERNARPFVSVVTPVYNGDEYLCDCIESVLAQTYDNWEYIILNNRSTDRTLEIAERYAAKDKRIRVYTNQHHLPIIANHNAALSLISSGSGYCKPLMADDWLFPECLARMVERAVSNPSVGLVCAYVFDGSKVVWPGLPYPQTTVNGRDYCRAKLLGAPYVFGSPTSMLIRADLIRKRTAFYDESNLHADYASCLDILQESDFGFVHQVLGFNRVHEKSHTSEVHDMESIPFGSLEGLVRYGPVFLSREEFSRTLSDKFDGYYRILAKHFLESSDKEFWEFHRRKLAGLGYALDKRKLARSVLAESRESMFHPRAFLRRIWKLPGAIHRFLRSQPSNSKVRRNGPAGVGLQGRVHSETRPGSE